MFDQSIQDVYCTTYIHAASRILGWKMVSGL